MEQVADFTEQTAELELNLEVLTTSEPETKSEYVNEIFKEFEKFEPELETLLAKKVLEEDLARIRAIKEVEDLDKQRKGEEVEPPKVPKVAAKPIKSDSTYGQHFNGGMKGCELLNMLDKNMASKGNVKEEVPEKQDSEENAKAITESRNKMK